MFIKIYHLFFSDIDGLGSSAIGGQLINRSSTHSPLGCDVVSSDAVTAGEFRFVTQHYQHIHSFISSVFLFFLFFSGSAFSRFVLTGVWKNLMDVLSTPLTGRMAGSSRSLSFSREQSQRERDAICLSLDGLRKAAALSCSLGN